MHASATVPFAPFSQSSPIETNRYLRDLEASLFRYARRRVPSEDLAQELVQETWLAALAAADRFSGRSTFRTWAIGILRRKLADYYRGRRHPAFPTALPELPMHAKSDVAVLDTVLVREQAERVAGALDGLSPREREAIELVAIQELDRDEVVEEMNPSRACLRVLLCRARRRLRDLTAEAA